jgi:hypothetical protein
MNSKKNSFNNYYLYILIFILIVNFIAFLYGTGLTNDDDVGFSVSNYNDLINLAIRQGRIFYIKSFDIIIPYLFDNELYYQSIKIFSFILLFFTISYTLNYFTDIKNIGVFSFILQITLVQNSWGFNLPLGYPLFFTAASVYFLISLIILDKLVNKFNLMLLTIFYLLNFYFLTEFFLQFTFLYAIIIWRQLKNPEIKKIIKLLIMAYLPSLIFIISYIIFRSLYTSAYLGNQMSSNSLNINNIIKVLTTLSFSSLPLLTFFSYKLYNISDLINKIKLEWIINAIIIFFISFNVLKENKKTISLKNFIIFFLIFAILFFIPNFLISLTQKYQHEVINLGLSSYVYTFFSYLAFIGIFSLTALFISSYIKQKRFFALLTSLIVAFSVLLVNYTNHYITMEIKLSHEKVKLFNYLIKSKVFSELPDQTLINTTSFFGNKIEIHNDNLNRLVKAKTGKNIFFTQQPSDYNYKLFFNQEDSAMNQYFILQKKDENIMRLFYSGKSLNNTFYLNGFTQEPYSDVLIGSQKFKSNGKKFFSVLIKPEYKGLERESEKNFNYLKINFNQAIEPENINISFFPGNLKVYSPAELLSAQGCYESEKTLRWCGKQNNAKFVILNKNKENIFNINFKVSSITDRHIQIKINDNFIDAINIPALEEVSVNLDNITLHSGENIMEISTDAPPVKPHKEDSRLLTFSIAEFTIDEDSTGLCDNNNIKKSSSNASANKNQKPFSTPFNFSKEQLPSYVSDITGFSYQEEWGRWTDANLSSSAKIKFNSFLPEKFTLEIKAIAFETNAHNYVKIRIKETEKTFYIKDTGKNIYQINFDGIISSDTIEIIPPHPVSPKDINLADDPRKLGLGLIHLKIIE